MKKARADVVQQPWGAQPPSSTMPPMQSQSQSPFANPSPTWYSTPHSYPQHMYARSRDDMGARYPPPQQGPPHHPAAPVPPMSVGQHPQHPPPQHQQHAQQQQHQQHQQQQHAQQLQQHPQHNTQQHAPAQAAPPPQQQTPTPAPAPPPSRQRKRPAPAAAPPPAPAPVAQPPTPVPAPVPQVTPVPAPVPPSAPAQAAAPPAKPAPADDASATPAQPPAKKSRTNTPWTPQEELRLKQMRDAGNSWAEIAKTFPSRTEGSVKKHWYKDMHYAEFAEDESQALLNAIKEYENNKWKVIGQKVGKPAKACEQYAKEHFADQFPSGSSKR